MNFVFLRSVRSWNRPGVNGQLDQRGQTVGRICHWENQGVYNAVTCSWFYESGCYCNKRLDWTWIAQTVYFTLVFHGKSRKGQELEDRFGDSLERMTAVTDRHSAYFALHFLNHQVCTAHLLRECQYLNELDKRGSSGPDRWKASFRKRYMNEIRSRRSRLTLSHVAWPPWQSHWWKFIKTPAGQQRLRTWNKKVENQTQKLRLLPFRPRCRCLYGSAFNRRDNQEARQLALQRNPRPF